VLRDDDDKKWSYPEHTAAKHAILIRYMKAWLPILGRYSNRLVIVDAFAGRGRYTTTDPGSPLLLRDLAGRVIADQRVTEAELFYIESNLSNWEELRGELTSAEVPLGVLENPPVHDTFERAAPAIVNTVRGTQAVRPSFWFVDPFGFAGLPLALINLILSPSRSEVLITLMVRDINRFLDRPNHQQADAELFGLRGDELLAAIERVKRAPSRTQALRDLYVERLEATVPNGRARFVTSVGVTERGASDIVYFLVHASGHPLGKREMKEAIWEATGELNAVVGARLAAETAGQQDMFSGVEVRETLVNYLALRRLLLERFAGRRIEYGILLNEAAIGHEFDGAIDRHIKTALEQPSADGLRRYRGGQLSARALSSNDILEFPAQ
jgi:three-Cys-motif partner protein